MTRRHGDTETGRSSHFPELSYYWYFGFIVKSWPTSLRQEVLQTPLAWALPQVYLSRVREPQDQLCEQELADLAPNGPDTPVRFRTVGGKPARSATERAVVPPR